MESFFTTHILFIPVASYIVVTILKGLFFWYKGAFTLYGMFGSGGMPSHHAAGVASLATAIGIKYGVFSDLFALSLVLAAVVIYDAMNIRYQSGLHARALNHLKGEKRLNESLGHLPSEALVGSMVGVLIAAVLMRI